MDCEPLRRGGASSHGPVNLVRHQMSVRDGLWQRVAVSRLIYLEEAQRISDGLPVLFVNIGSVLHHTGCRSQADLDGIEVVKRAPPLPVDAAVALVDNNQIE